MGLQVLLDLASAMHGDRVAVGPRGGGTTFARLADLSRGGAALIRGSGARHVAFVGVHGRAFSIALFAAARAGVPITPLNYRLTDDALASLLAELPEPLVIADADVLPRIATAAHRVGALTTTEFVDGARTRSGELVEEAAEDGDRPAIVLFTSGTTSTPKGVPLTHSNLTSYVLQTLEPGSAADADAALVTVPPYHVAGIAAVLSNTYAARRTVFLPRFTAEDWLGTVRAEGVTTAMLVPTMLARVTELLAGAPADTPTLRALSYGGASMPATVLERALRAFPDTGFTHAYGLTETSSTIAVLGPDDHRAALSSEDRSVARRLGSVGRAVPGVELTVRLESGEPAPVGVAGDLYVRGPQVSAGYVGRGSALDGGGWFATRDRAWSDADGYLFIEGRTDDTIIRGGENIAPAEIEDVLLRHPHVADAAVVGLPDEEWGERIAAVLVPATGVVIDTDEVRTWARARLRGSKTPDVVVVWTDLPYNDLGKLLRREVVAGLLPHALRSGT